VLAERRVPQWLQPLQHRLLDHPVDHGWDTEVACPAGRFRDLHPTHRLRLVAPLQQLIFDLRPARFQDARELSNGDTVDAGCSLVAHHRTQCRFYVLRITDHLHQMLGGCRTFGFGPRRGHFDLSRVRTRGFTPARCRQVQCELEWRSRYGLEISELLALSFNPLRGPFGPSVAEMTYYASADFCIAVRAPCGPLTPSGCPWDTTQIFWGKPRSLPRTPARFTVRAFDGYGLRDFLPARPTRAASYPVAVRQVAISFHAAFRRSLAVRPCASLVLHLHQVAQGTFTPRLLDMPSTQDASRRLRRWPEGPSLTAAAHSAPGRSGRDEETAPFSRTKKHHWLRCHHFCTT
jgi:hypothetical protein